MGINGDFVGRPCFIKASVVGVVGDTLKLASEGGYCINCLSGKLEKWCDEDLGRDEYGRVNH